MNIIVTGVSGFIGAEIYNNLPSYIIMSLVFIEINTQYFVKIKTRF